ncbi:hypothetical protein CK203_078852 [Vitis vinifera]|uniref:ACB domain-containing protein n=1 Tax=Vitis vinifera TaxID=29760 RepID=A0A438FBV5_VITVI|nr:hypothetical protein CK203_078852 [Vitis vinifera]
MKLCNIRLGPTLGQVPGNAWQRLGNMSPEAAMEQYVALLSRDIPGWSVDDPLEAVTYLFRCRSIGEASF